VTQAFDLGAADRAGRALEAVGGAMDLEQRAVDRLRRRVRPGQAHDLTLEGREVVGQLVAEHRAELLEELGFVHVGVRSGTG
jgi:hypothetical protein